MTTQQEKSVKAQVQAKLSAIFSDNSDCIEVENAIVKDVISDIDETADWSGLAPDEVIVDDINIAIARVLKNRIVDASSEESEIDKQRFIEQVYFDAKASLDDDKLQHLDNPVEDYDSFYLSPSEETIYVWNTKKRNYKSIFSMPTDTAYEIAKMIDNGEYEEEGDDLDTEE